MNQIQRVLKLFRKTTTIRASDLQAKHIPRSVLTRMVSAGLLEKVSHGLYRQAHTQMSEKEEMVNIALRVPKAVFCLFTALQFHELTTQLPRQIWIAMPQGSHKPRIDYPPIQMIQLTEKAYVEGIDTVVVDQVPIKIYNPAKTVVDCFKFRNKIGLDVALEALKDALHQKKATSYELYYFAKIARVDKIMLPYMEAMAL
jgi:predicted transcriptional regulator of viral defense system